MGMVVDGRWVDEDRHIMYGRYLRPKSVYSDDLDADLAGRFRSQPGRYRLIASLSCPWSHRAMLVRALKGLEDCVPLQIAGGLRAEGYAVNGGASWAVPGTGTRIRHLHELYTLSDPRRLLAPWWPSRTPTRKVGKPPLFRTPPQPY